MRLHHLDGQIISKSAQFSSSISFSPEAECTHLILVSFFFFFFFFFFNIRDSHFFFKSAYGPV